MVAEIRLHIEGGGDGKDSKGLLREGFSIFFQELRDGARERRISWKIIQCGSRNDAFKHFLNALGEYPDAFNVLLVDAEGPVQHAPLDHLRQRDNWEVANLNEDKAHLMVQLMEAWIVADREALGKFYGQGFYANRIPKNPNVEEIDRRLLLTSLEEATRNTSKGVYRKIHHASKLLQMIEPSKVRQAAPHCNRLFQTLAREIGMPLQ